MKKFYLHDGVNQQGPFDIEELKTISITKETPIWFEGLSEWTSAAKVEELKGILNKVTPPPFEAKVATPPPLQNVKSQERQNIHSEPKNKSKLGYLLILIGVLGAVAIIISIISNHDHSGGSADTDPQNYQEKVMTVEEIERSQPTNFLTADGNYNENFWGTKIKVHGVIKNSATVASYKDAVVRITYYSKTKTALGSSEYTIYDNFPPHSEVNFELKIDNYKDVNAIGWEVIQAVAN